MHKKWYLSFSENFYFPIFCEVWFWFWALFLPFDENQHYFLLSFLRSFEVKYFENCWRSLALFSKVTLICEVTLYTTWRVFATRCFLAKWRIFGEVTLFGGVIHWRIDVTFFRRYQNVQKYSTEDVSSIKGFRITSDFQIEQIEQLIQWAKAITDFVLHSIKAEKAEKKPQTLKWTKWILAQKVTRARNIIMIAIYSEFNIILLNFRII